MLIAARAIRSSATATTTAMATVVSSEWKNHTKRKVEVVAGLTQTHRNQYRYGQATRCSGGGPVTHNETWTPAHGTNI